MNPYAEGTRVETRRGPAKVVRLNRNPDRPRSELSRAQDGEPVEYLVVELEATGERFAAWPRDVKILRNEEG